MLRQTLRRLGLAIVAAVALAGVMALATACGSDDPSMGERMEDAADSVSDSLEEAEEEVRDEVDDHTN